MFRDNTGLITAKVVVMSIVWFHVSLLGNCAWLQVKSIQQALVSLRPPQSCHALVAGPSFSVISLK